MKIFISEICGPFYIFSKGNINWSRIPFNDLENKNKIDPQKEKKLISILFNYLDQISSLGFNGVSLDDLAHLVSMPFYSNAIREKLNHYRFFYKKLFSIIKEKKLKIFIKTDFMFYNREIIDYLKIKRIDESSMFRIFIEKAFEEYPELEGIIIRIGECDGVDIVNDFKSKITIKSAKQLNHFLKMIIPIFETYQKKIILRNWTVGINKVGDLIWNEKTLKKSLHSIESKNFFLSMKYGETDFFKGIELSKLINATNHQKIIEFQTRREYEGFGTFPVFVGWDYQSFLKKMKKNKNIVGIWVWPSEGGWCSFKNIFAFIKNKSSIWNELNTYTTINIAKNNWPVKKCIFSFYENFINKKDTKNEKIKFLRIVKLADQVIKNGYYIKEIVKKQIFFNRFRLPPLLFPIWQYVTVNDFIYYISKYLVRKKDLPIKDSLKALRKIKMIKKIAREINLNQNWDYYYDTFYIIFLIRKLIFKEEKNFSFLEQSIKNYEKKYENHFYFIINCQPCLIKSIIFRLIFKIFLRKNKKYHLFHRLVINKLTFFVLRRIFYFFGREKFITNKIGMPVDYFFN
ncbi:MAG: hypothetical protein NZL96_01105 [Patescibacteria group bacterium]|nr:hypothetical protein [Patescibacteria group bacterium]